MKNLIILAALFFILPFLEGLGVVSFAQNRTIDSLLMVLKTEKPDTGKIIRLNQLTSEYKLIGDYEKGLKYGTEALGLARKLSFKKGIAQADNNIGNIYLAQADYPKALDCYLKALKVDEEIKSKKGIAARFGNIGIVYFNQNEYPQALNYFFKALKMAEEIGDKTRIEIQLGNIGNVYTEQSDYYRALDYYFKASKIGEELGNKNGIAVNFSNIGRIYFAQNDYPKALDYYFKALKMQEELGDKNSIATDLGNIGELYTAAKKYKEAEEYLKKAAALDNSIGALNGLRQDELSLSQLYETIERYKLALVHYKKAVILKDTLFSQESKKQLIRKEMNYEFDKKEAATKAEHNKDMAVAEAEKKKQKIIIWSVMTGLFLVIVFAGFVYRSLRITRKQKNIIELQKNEVDKQREIVEKQKEKIVASITYAQRIQQSILMEESEIQNYLPECFIYFQPKDIVSGDFYWCSKLGDKIIIAAVDCTGHGVPGAFMSMIGNTLLNQIVNEKHITKPSEILHYLNLGVYEALHQKKDGALADDGMDIALCCIDYKNKEVQYAGQNPFNVLSNGKIEVIKGDIYGIGGGGIISKLHDPLKKVFTNHVIPIKEGMSIYLSTDGYMDQFGGSERKKFGSQRFKDLLLKNHHMSMQKQKELIASANEEWKGNTMQIDDVLVIGIRVKLENS